MDRVVVVGASLAGLHAVEALRKNGYQGEIVLVGAEPHLPYDRPPLSKEALRDGPDHGTLLLKEPSWYGEHAVDLRLGTPAVGLDARAKSLFLQGGQPLDYDGLMIATGSVPRQLGSLAGVGNVYVLRNLMDAVRLHEELLPGRHLVVIGAGFIGLEVAATARGMGLDVSVIEVAPAPLSRVLGDKAGGWFTDLHADHGVDLYCGAALDGIEAAAGSTKLRLADGTLLAAELVVAGVGVAPATGWLRGSGVEVTDGVVCDRYLRTSAPGVVAAGDIARWRNDLFGETMRVEQWFNAVEQGAHAARTLLGSAEAFAPVPYFWSDQFDGMIRFVGRADGAEATATKQLSERSMVTLFGRGGVIRGALCINAPRQLVRYRQAIEQRAPWAEVADID